MASRAILAGIKTAAVINVGTATIGALIGAGGFGQPILTGIRRDDLSMILFEGAIPAALLALAVQGAFDLAERFLVPQGTLRDSNQSTIRYWTAKYRRSDRATGRPSVKPARDGQPAEMLERVLVRIFGMDRLASLERELRARDPDDLGLAG